MRFTEEEVREMAYDKSIFELGKCPYLADPSNPDPIRFYGMIRTPSMHKAERYKWDPETGVNTNPNEEYIDPRRINRLLASVIYPEDLANYLHYAERVSTNHPGTKFWLCDYTDVERKSEEYYQKRNEWFLTHRFDYFIPDWIIKGDRSSSHVLVGVCLNGEWKIKEKYCSEVAKVLPGGLPGNYHRVA